MCVAANTLRSPGMSVKSGVHYQQILHHIPTRTCRFFFHILYLALSPLKQPLAGHAVREEHGSTACNYHSHIVHIKIQGVCTMERNPSLDSEFVRTYHGSSSYFAVFGCRPLKPHLISQTHSIILLQQERISQHRDAFLR